MGVGSVRLRVWELLLVMVVHAVVASVVLSYGSVQYQIASNITTAVASAVMGTLFSYATEWTARSALLVDSQLALARAAARRYCECRWHARVPVISVLTRRLTSATQRRRRLRRARARSRPSHRCSATRRALRTSATRWGLSACVYAFAVAFCGDCVWSLAPAHAEA
jgi:hypothetical protein